VDIGLAVFAIIVIAVSLWVIGALGGNRMLSAQNSQARVKETLDAIPAFGSLELSPTITIDSQTESVREQTPSDKPSTPTPWAGKNEAASTALLAGSLSLGVALFDFLHVDKAVFGAVEQATGADINNVLDLRSTLARGGTTGSYDLASHGSLINWRGHVFEHQVFDQVQSWAPDGAVNMPDAGNFPGADLNIFGEGYQLKTTADFNAIDNIHHDPLIVADGTTNLPDDAINVDFSQPFDPSLIEGHGVIVAEGLSAAGATAAWEDGIGLDGLDHMDSAQLADLGGHMLLPGIGAAIKVVMNGVKRRKGLANSDTRSQTLLRLSQDSGETVSAVVAGGVIGALIGVSIDVAALGATAGAGVLVGKAVGSFIGGLFASKRSQARDAAAIHAAKTSLDQALGKYGQSVEAHEEVCTQLWSDAVSAADQRAKQASKVRQEQFRSIQRHALRDLELTMQIPRNQRSDMLATATSLVQSVAQTGWSLPAIIRRSQWLRTANSSIVEQFSAQDFLVFIAQTPHADSLVSRWGEGATEQREKTFAGLQASSELIGSAALRDRISLIEELNDYRQELSSTLPDAVVEATEDVKKKTKLLEDQMVIAGQTK